MKSIIVLAAFNTTAADGLEFGTAWVTEYPSEDIVPDALNWTDTISVSGGPYNSTAERVTGIGTSITLRITTSTTITLLYKKSFDSLEVNYSLNTTGWTSVANGGTFTVLPNQYVGFVRTGTKTGNALVTVQNNSDGNATLDTFNTIVNSL